MWGQVCWRASQGSNHPTRLLTACWRVRMTADRDRTLLVPILVRAIRSSSNRRRALQWNHDGNSSASAAPGRRPWPRWGPGRTSWRLGLQTPRSWPTSRRSRWSRPKRQGPLMRTSGSTGTEASWSCFGRRPTASTGKPVEVPTVTDTVRSASGSASWPMGPGDSRPRTR